MASKRVLHGGKADLKGDRINGLIVGEYVSRNPMRWATTCERCQTQSVHAHALLMNGGARCLNTGCGKEALREAASDTPRKAREREQAAEAARQQSIADAKAAQLRDLESDINEKQRTIGKLVREKILAGKDNELFISDATRDASMSRADADKFNREQAELCVKNHPEMRNFNNEKSITALYNYFNAHQINIIDAETFYRAFERLRDYGLLEANPAPTPTYKPVEYVEPTPPPAAVVQKEIGIDPRTGEEREYTAYEIARMGSDEYRRVFRIYKDRLALPTHAAF